jgi:hypothetical protein
MPRTERPDTTVTGRRQWVRPVALLALSLACGWIIVGLVGRVDWDAVLDAIRRLALWQVPILLAVLAVRQLLNASPLALFIDGLGINHAVQNDQAATMMSTVAPPPADLVLRLSMFKSWGIPVSQGLAGAMMNTVTFYATRFIVPVLGLVLLLASDVPYHGVYGWTAALGAVVAAIVLVVLWAVLRQESAAVWVGTTAGRLGARVRKSVDPEGWAASAVDFRSHVVLRSRRGVPTSLALLVVMVVVDGLLLSLCFRFVGVPADEVSILAVTGVFLVSYPLTLFPLAGLGILDATVLAALVDTGGLHLEPQLVAGLVLYRVVTLSVPLLLGALSVAWWRRMEAEQ